MKTLGERIADLRRERGITQENLAGTIGVSAQAISKWENNAKQRDHARYYASPDYSRYTWSDD